MAFQFVQSGENFRTVGAFVCPFTVERSDVFSNYAANYSEMFFTIRKCASAVTSNLS